MFTVVELSQYPGAPQGFVTHVRPDLGGVEIFFPDGLGDGTPAVYVLEAKELRVVDLTRSMPPEKERLYNSLPRPNQLTSMTDLLLSTPQEAEPEPTDEPAPPPQEEVHEAEGREEQPDNVLPPTEVSLDPAVLATHLRRMLNLPRSYMESLTRVSDYLSRYFTLRLRLMLETENPQGWALIKKESSPFYGLLCFWTEPPTMGVSRAEMCYTVRVLVPNNSVMPYRRYFASDLDFVEVS